MFSPTYPLLLALPTLSCADFLVEVLYPTWHLHYYLQLPPHPTYPCSDPLLLCHPTIPLYHDVSPHQPNPTTPTHPTSTHHLAGVLYPVRSLILLVGHTATAWRPAHPLPSLPKFLSPCSCLCDVYIIIWSAGSQLVHVSKSLLMCHILSHRPAAIFILRPHVACVSIHWLVCDIQSDPPSLLQ